MGGALFLVVTLTVLARAPAELNAQYDQIQSAHSFAYNRLGTGFAAVAAAVLLVAGRNRGSEVLGGAVIGTAVIGAMLCKSTFFPVVPIALVALAIQARWSALGAAVAMGGLVLMILDPMAAQTVNTLRYSVESSGHSTGSDWLLRKYIKMIWSHQIQLMLLSAIFAMLWWMGPKGVWRTILSAILFIGAFWAATVTMGQPNHIGQQNVPLLVASGLAALAFVPARAAGGDVIRALSLVLFAAFVIPQTAIFAVTSWKAATKTDQLAITEGPMRGYLVDEPLRDGKNRIVNVVSTPLDERIEAAAASMKNGKNGSVYSYYAMADAVRILEGIDASELGLISDTRMGLGFFAGARMVTHYPAWPRKDARELKEGYPMLSDTDMILFLRPNPSKWTEIIEARMGDDFQPCRQSPFWNLVVRERQDFCRE